MRRLAALAALLLAVPAAQAQDDPALPDLTPREFEIRGEVQVSIPDLERQPLSGFGPLPRPPATLAQRRAFVPTYGQELSALPPMVLPPAPEPQVQTANPRYVQLDALAGRYGTYAVGLDAGVPAGNGAAFARLRVDALESYSPTVSPGGAVPFEAEAPATTFDLSGGYRSFGGVSLEAFALRTDYRLYAAALTPTGSVQPERTGLAFGAGGGYDGRVFDLAARIEQASYEVGAAANGPAFPEESLSELRVEAAGGLSLFGNLVRVEGSGMTAGLDDRGSVRSFSGGLLLRPVDGDRARVVIGVRALGYDAAPENGDGNATAIAPVLDAEVFLASGLRLYARTDGSVAPQGYRNLYAENPWAETDPVVSPNLDQAVAEAGVEFQSGLLTLRFLGGGQYSPVYRYFSLNPATGLYDVGYSTATVFEGGAEISFAAASGFTAGGGVRIRQGELTQLNQDIPNFSNVVIHGGIEVPFLGRGLVGVSAEVATGRFVSLGDANKVDGYGLVTADARYRVFGPVSVRLRLERALLEPDVWRGYPRPSFTLLGGLSVAL